MLGADSATKAGRTLATCFLAATFIGAVPRPQPAFDDKISYLKAARLAARESLGRPECQAVLSDFRDGSSRRLEEVLGTAGRTAQEQLDRLELESGLGRHDCDRSPVMAFTRVHSTVVSVCLQHFRVIGREQQEAALIHEMLHSLGLGENPGESGAITARILKRCGR
jgi:hypothetical protein